MTKAEQRLMDETIAAHNALLAEHNKLQKSYKALEKKFKTLSETSVTWSIGDFMDYDHDDYDINKKQAESALKEMIREHDYNEGITWDTVHYYFEKWGTKIN